jgi:hypothetical protein
VTFNINLEKRDFKADTAVVMPEHRKQGKKSIDPFAVHILNSQEYGQILGNKKTFVFHLTRALFPAGTITPSALERVVSRKLPTSGNYNAVFHFGRKRGYEVTAALKQARNKMAHSKGHWFVKFTDADRAATVERVKKLVPRGMIKSSVINAALAGQTA